MVSPDGLCGVAVGVGVGGIGVEDGGYVVGVGASGKIPSRR